MQQSTARLNIGVVGHRPNRLWLGETEIERRLRITLRHVRQGARQANVPPSRVAVISALAEGADRLFAEAAVDLNFKLHVILPFPCDEYARTFDDPKHRIVFRELMVKATVCNEWCGDLGQSEQAFESLGREIVAHSDVLLAVWDGRPAAGPGGTTDVIERALWSKVPVVWIDATKIRLPRLLRVPATRDPRSVPLKILAARAGNLTRAKLCRLVKDILQPHIARA